MTNLLVLTSLFFFSLWLLMPSNLASIFRNVFFSLINKGYYLEMERNENIAARKWRMFPFDYPWTLYVNSINNINRVPLKLWSSCVS